MSQVPRPRRRFLLRTLAVLFVLAGALLVGLRFYLSSRAAARRVADALEDMLGMPVEVESARIGLFGSSTIRRLRIYESADADVPLITIDRAEADLSALGYLRGRTNPG